MNKTALFLAFMLAFTLVQTIALASTNITTCQALSSENETYYLTQNISSIFSCEESDKCMVISSANNITLDCLGHEINSYTDYGSCSNAVWNRNGDGYSGGENLTIKNCIFHGWNSITIYSDYNNTVVDNCTFIANAYSVRFNSMNSILRNSNIVSSSWIFIGSNYPQEQQNYYYNNIISTYPAIEMDTLNYWNNSESGNNWTPGYSDTCDNFDNDTFCDIPFNLSSSDNNTDFLPLTFYNFTENLIAPKIFIYSPVNTTYDNENIFFNYTVIDYNSTNISLVLYINGNVVDNYSALNDTNFNGFNLFPISNWTYNFTIWANDTNGITNQSEVIFTIFIITVAPINYTSPYPLNTSWNYCSDNQTLRIHLAQYDNGTFISSNDSYVICPYGCSGDSCNWNPIYSYLSALIVLIIITITLWRLFK